MGGERALDAQAKKEGQGSPLLSGADFFGLWNPGPRNPLKMPADFQAPAGDSPAKPRLDLLQFLPRGDGAKPADRVADVPVRDGVLELDYADRDFDRKIQAARDFKTLKITGMPADKQILTWADERGYYFFFGPDDKQNHYFPSSLKVIEVNGKRFDMDRSRLQVSETFMKQYTGSPGGFENFGRGANALDYFWRMSKVGENGLAWQEKILKDAAANSNNPYFRIYLADVMLMQSLKPIIDGALAGNITPEQKQKVIDRLSAAEKELKEAERMSHGALYQKNQFPQRNVELPLAPGAFLFGPRPGYPDPYFSYWGGAWDQSLRREAFITLLKGYINAGALNYIQLPPDMSRR